VNAKTKRRNPEALEKLKKRLSALGNKEVAMGFPRGEAQPYPDGSSVASVAAQHVYGVGVIERDFMTPAAAKIQKSAKPLLKQIAQIINKGIDPAQAEALLEEIGKIGIAEIQNSIDSGDWPANSNMPMSERLRKDVAESWDVDIPKGMSYLEAKLEFKGSDKPLVDTHHMVQAVTSVVRDKS
jgi:hypothetical protein